MTVVHVAQVSSRRRRLRTVFHAFLLHNSLIMFTYSIVVVLPSSWLRFAFAFSRSSSEHQHSNESANEQVPGTAVIGSNRISSLFLSIY